MCLTISKNPKVYRCIDGESGGFDYKYDVELKDGFEFGSGRMEGCNNARFNTVGEFSFAAKYIRVSHE